jgi:hypothetical protein
VVPNTGFEGASLVKPFHFTLFGRKWLQLALEAGGEALPNRVLLKGHDHYLSYLEQSLEAARITITLLAVAPSLPIHVNIKFLLLNYL